MSRRRREEHEEHPDESWLLPYSDLMTLLLALFIVLYSVSSVNVSKLEELSQAFKTAFSSGLGVLDGSTILEDDNRGRRTDDIKLNRDDGKLREKERQKLQQEEQEHLEELQEQLNKYIVDNGLTSQLETSLTRTQLLITIRDNALFASASAAVKPEAQKLAIAIADMLSGYPDFQIQVAGHTDNLPINTAEFPSNWELSTMRATNFMKILLERTGFDPSLFSAIGYSEYHPIETNDTVEGRAKNRRVEVSILRNYTDQTTENEGQGQQTSISVADAAQ